MTLDDVSYLKSEEAQKLLRTYKDTRPQDLPRLTMKLKKKGFSQAHLITSQLNLRAKAQAKFSRASKMLFTPEGLEQATPEPVARHIAERFNTLTPEEPIADLSCGIGGNTLAFAHYTHVIANDTDQIALETARYNTHVYEVENRISFLNVDILTDNLPSATAFFLDPARAQNRPTKTRSLFNTEPPLNEVLSRLIEHMPHGGGVKISPAFDYAELDDIPYPFEVEVIGHGKKNAVAMLWFGKLAQHIRSATLISTEGGTQRITADDTTPLPHTSDIKSYLFEPHPAFRKAHLITELAQEYNLAQVDEHLALLTGDTLPTDSTLFRIFKVKDIRSFSWANIANLIGEYNVTRADITTRAFPLSPDELRKELKLPEGGSYTLLFVTVQNRYLCVLTQQIP